jgi:4-azaleucine resistance transporter AzlC
LKYENELKKAFKISIPIMMGYLVLGFAFGLLLVSFDYSWYLAPIMSFFIYTGALQFIAINFFNIKAGYVDIAIASFFINIRQAFYGLSLLKRFNNSGKLKPYLIFALTDENYALLTSIKDDESLNKKWYYFFLLFFSQLYWLVGSTLGAVFGSNIKFQTQGLEFSLTALFVVLCIEQYKNLKNAIPFVIAFISSLFSLIFVPSDKMLIVSIFISIAMIFLFQKKIENE